MWQIGHVDNGHTAHLAGIVDNELSIGACRRLSIAAQEFVEANPDADLSVFGWSPDDQAAKRAKTE